MQSVPGFLSAFCLISLFSNFRAAAQVAPSATPQPWYPPPPSHFYNDYAGLTSPQFQTSMDKQLADLKGLTKDQLVVAILKQKQSPASFDDYCSQVIEHWGVGHKGQNHGVVLFVFANERVVKISVGQAVQRALPDQDRKKIVDEFITPDFNAGNYEEGIRSAVQAIMAALYLNPNRTEPVNLPKTNDSST